MIDNNLNLPNKAKYEIYTFGRFDVVKNDRSLVVEASGSKKLWELYKFMLTNRDRAFTPDDLMDSLWISEEYSDPKSTLRRQMFRLKEILKEDDCGDCPKTLVLSNGQYRWNKDVDIYIDAEEFESFAKKGDSLKESSPKEAVKAYLKSIDLYTGDYLSNSTEQHWVYPVRNQYRRLYLNTVVNAVNILKEFEEYGKIIEVCNRAIKIDIYEESFHINYMEALLNFNQKRQALEHYEYITSFFYKEMGIKPSPEMKEIYKKLLKNQSLVYSETSINEAFGNGVKAETAYYCKPEIFKSIYELERRRSQRSKEKVGIGVLTVAFDEKNSISKKELKMKYIKQLLLERLRKGDTFTRWNENQFLVLLQGVDVDVTKNVLQRVIGAEEQNGDVIIDEVSYLTSEYR